MSNELIIYYSRADENYVSGQLKHLEKGNTQIVAEEIAKLTGANIFKVEQKFPYSKDYNECVDEAQQDQRSNARPELISLPETGSVDTIYLGYPNYWSTLPMAMFTLLESIDLSGKTIRPFCTHEGSGFGKSLDDLSRLCPNSKIESGLSIYGSRASKSQSEIEKWVKEK